MGNSRFGFFFEKSGLGEQVGPIDSSEEYFRGEQAIASLARETGQNAIDAHDDAAPWPVRMEFELATMDVADIPGIDGLREHLESASRQWRADSGSDRLKQAAELARRETIPVLRVSDFNTTGLTGSESTHSPNSALSALTRGAGISAKPGGGGSFGIGSAVGPANAELKTVLYTSLPNDEDEIVFAGYTRLASHKLADGTWLGPCGYFTDLSDTTDFKWQRSPAPIGPFSQRTEAGTDIYILGYRMAESDPSLTELRNAYIREFTLALHRGKLEVSGKSADSEWLLNADTLGDYVRQLPDALAFYNAIQDPQPTVGHHPLLGEVSLYVHVDDSLDRSYHSYMVRRQLMKIGGYRPTTIKAKYAAVFECSTQEGNELLRQLEPPEHNKWDPGRAPGGSALIWWIRKFVRDGVAARIQQDLGDELEIQGLAELLPADFGGSGGRHGTNGVPFEGPTDGQESAGVHGEPAGPQTVFNEARKAVRVKVGASATSGGPEEGTKGRDTGGDGSRETNKAGIDARVGEGDGRSRIPSGDLRFRSWSNGPTSIVVSISTNKPIGGDLELVALGPGGAPEHDYELPILRAAILSEREPTPVTFTNNMLRDLVLTAGTTRLELTLSAPHRFRLGVR